MIQGATAVAFNAEGDLNRDSYIRFDAGEATVLPVVELAVRRHDQGGAVQHPLAPPHHRGIGRNPPRSPSGKPHRAVIFVGRQEQPRQFRRQRGRDGEDLATPPRQPLLKLMRHRNRRAGDARLYLAKERNCSHIQRVLVADLPVWAGSPAATNGGVFRWRRPFERAGRLRTRSGPGPRQPARSRCWSAGRRSPRASGSRDCEAIASRRVRS